MYGSHLSISGGLHNAVLAAEKLKLDTVQIFTKNQPNAQSAQNGAAVQGAF